jgi:hypothetical protein
MNIDVERANEALAGGRPDEASVYAWNALADLRLEDAAELGRIAREVNDQQLLREIERRGFSTEPPQPVAEPEEPEESKPLLRLRRLWPVLVVLLLVIAAVEIVPVESEPRHPTLDDVASGPESRPPTLNVPTGVWLVPLGDVTSVDVGRLANELALRYRIPVAALRGLALANLDSRRQRAEPRRAAADCASEALLPGPWPRGDRRHHGL